MAGANRPSLQLGGRGGSEARMSTALGSERETCNEIHWLQVVDGNLPACSPSVLDFFDDLK